MTLYINVSKAYKRCFGLLIDEIIGGGGCKKKRQYKYSKMKYTRGRGPECILSLQAFGFSINIIRWNTRVREDSCAYYLYKLSDSPLPSLPFPFRLIFSAFDPMASGASTCSRQTDELLLLPHHFCCKISTKKNSNEYPNSSTWEENHPAFLCKSIFFFLSFTITKYYLKHYNL